MARCTLGECAVSNRRRLKLILSFVTPNRMFGSHTHWAWPRFVEEIVPCLLDATRVTARSGVGNDNGELTLGPTGITKLT